MALLYPLKSTDFILLDYIATHKGFRGKGIGEAFIRVYTGKLEEQKVLQVLTSRS